MTWQTPITDRTATDLTNRTAKAFFNVADFLRVYGNSQIANQLTNLYLSLSIPFTTLTAPTVTSFPTAAEINDLVENIDLLRAAACLPASTGVVALDYAYTEGSSGVAPDYTDVNAWEEDLIVIRRYLGYTVNYLVHSGVAQCGQARFWQVQFRDFPFAPVASPLVRRPRCSLIVCGSDMTRQNFFRRYA